MANTQGLQSQIDHLRLEVQSLKQQKGAEEITVGNYLLTRLAQLGVTDMFGLPGDFNLGFLDLVEDHPTIEWVGNCNELNAAYAADGYARVKAGSLGVVLTTFGVGELSATNGIAGAFSEMVPVLHVVGVPSTNQQKTKPMLHHTLGDGRFDAYATAAAQFSVYQALLENKDEAPAKIDRALTECITQVRPVYLTLPTDLVYQKISSERLQIPLTPNLPLNDPQTEEYVLELIEERVKEAEGDVIVLIDACVIRHGVKDEVKALLEATGFPVYSTPMGKTAIDESYGRYGGIYVGSITAPEIKEKVESAKLILSIGALLSDFNTGNFTYKIPTRRNIELHSTHTKVQYGTFDGIHMKYLLPKLTERLKSFHSIGSQLVVPKFVKEVPHEDTPIITHAWFWPRFGRFFQPKDVIVTETGTANFGILDIPLPPQSVLVSQILWGSIGWSVGSCLGAALGARDIGLGRVILFVGDGSLNHSHASSWSQAHLVVLNNKGYSIERYIHGKHRKYNDIVEWRWTDLVKTLGDLDGSASQSYTVTNKQEMDELLNDPEFAAANKFQLVEVLMEALDAPRALEAQAEMTGAGNAYASKQ
ncbi:pyruvate decarboxylase THI3 [Cyathus striatus]|nr:pyruvate decarboxylase THI3 [Cyathus striatus]